MYREHRRIFFTLFVALVLFLAAPTAFARVPDSQLRIARAIQLVRSAEGSNSRVDAAEQLRNLVFGTDASGIDDGTIHAVASLLEFNNDATRYWIAEALGHFGSRASFAVPKLLSILKEEECVIKETSSEGVIRDTLERIGQPAPREKCKHYLSPK